MTEIQTKPIEHQAEIVKVEASPLATMRCDRCGAQAYAEVELPSKSILLFCAHHLRESKAGLMTKAKRIIDYTQRLEAQD